jgi:membrane protease YdiL (CAAX protease family)
MRSDFRGPTGAAVFYAITLGLALLIALFPVFGERSTVVTMLTPAIAVLVMVLLFTRDGWTRSGWTALGVNRLGLKGWWLAILGPIAVLGLSYGILILVGQASLKLPEMSRPLGETLLGLGLSLVVGTLYAFCEELGWRGYMLPRVARPNILAGMLLVGFCQGVWHLPLMLLTPYYHTGANMAVTVPLFLITLTLAGILYGYLFFSTWSVWPVAIAHGVYNFVWNLGSEFLAPASPETMELWGGESGVLAIVGLVIVSAILLPRIQGWNAWLQRRVAAA